MHGKHFLYVLVRTDGLCLKVGVTSDFRQRMSKLRKTNGPFRAKLSFAVRIDTRKQADAIEQSVKSVFWGSRIQIPRLKHRNGEKEWFAAKSYDDIVHYLKTVSTIQNGIEGKFQQIDFRSLPPLSHADKRGLRRFKYALTKIIAQINAKTSNTDNELIFKGFVEHGHPKLEGVARVKEADSRNETYELYFQPESFSRDQLNEFRHSASLIAENENLGGFLNLSTRCESRELFQKIAFCFPLQTQDYEGTWESRGYIPKFKSRLDDLADENPLPKRFEPYIGKSLFDDVSPEEFWRACFKAFGPPPFDLGRQD